VVLRKRLAAVLVLLTLAAMPQWLGLGAHALAHHEHDGEAAGHGPEWSGLAESLVHGHQHAEGVPEHEHRLLPSPTFRPDPPQDPDTPVLASLEPAAADPLPPAGSASEPPGACLSGSGPPRLHLLCTLLI
jgi:hypothetical protein